MRVIAVAEGNYEIQAFSSGLYLNSLTGAVYNHHIDDALVLNSSPTRTGKWEIAHVGSGYTIKQVSSGLYCSLKQNDDGGSPLIVLRPVPTVWDVEFQGAERKAICISWPVTGQCWSVPTLQSNGQAGPVLAQLQGGNMLPKAWRMLSLQSNDESGPLLPGLYAIQNKVSDTFVSLSPDEKSIGCWPAVDLASTGVKLWVIAPLGRGYTIRLQGTDKYCTLQSGTGSGSQISVSTVPAAWRIEPTHSPVKGQNRYYRIFWADTDMVWDLEDYGKRTAVKMMHDNGSQACRHFQLIA
ncbi:hypothetical protein PsYK624_149670 [Phanerochaete sordida]|uniref:Uncharacterized protein n=1 Tax=Phanerochaete sordida TaxID=48140 RepID=A0A9P3GNG6_9APHY|nr:hypothetical protein PsYK624_149670 [Phanerochaete sordida]